MDQRKNFSELNKEKKEICKLDKSNTNKTEHIVFFAVDEQYTINLQGERPPQFFVFSSFSKQTVSMFVKNCGSEVN